jgi:uncharacterized protein (DUF58 family)
MTHVCKRSTAGIVRDAPGGAATMSAGLGWALALLAVAAGYVSYGWQGVVLAVTVIVFWLLLQFSRSLRALRDASGRPVGEIDNAVMLHARLHPGMRLMDVLKLTRSLGRKVADEPETFAWRDGDGSEVRVELRGGRLSASSLVRAAADGTG